MYGTVSTICCDLLKVYENNEKIPARRARYWLQSVREA